MTNAPANDTVVTFDSLASIDDTDCWCRRPSKVRAALRDLVWRIDHVRRALDSNGQPTPELLELLDTSEAAALLDETTQRYAHESLRGGSAQTLPAATASPHRT